MIRLETKAAIGVDEAGVITGMAWPFGTPDRVNDTITKGAFGSLGNPVPMLAFHNPDDPVGAWNHVVETDAGLEVKGRLLIDDVPRARELRALVQSGAVAGLSIGFSPKSWTGTKGRDRKISALSLVEISLVTVPSHPGARVTEAKRLQSVSSAIVAAEALSRFADAIRSKNER